jgi:hypothetical protein
VRVASGAQLVVAEGLLFDIRKWVNLKPIYVVVLNFFLNACLFFFR